MPDGETLCGAFFELRDERTVRQDAGFVRRAQPPHHTTERRSGRTREREARGKGGCATEQRGPRRQDDPLAICARLREVGDLRRRGAEVVVVALGLDTRLPREVAGDAALPQELVEKLQHVSVLCARAPVSHQLEGAEEVVLGDDVRGHTEDRGVPGGCDGLGVVVELLAKLLAGPHAHELDLDVPIGTQAAHANHLARELDDAYRLAHVEQEHFAFLGDRAGLQYESYGFGDRHEVARHPRVGHGDRATLEDLPEERRHDASSATEHVAETQGRERERVLPTDGEDDLFGRAFRRAEHRVRRGRLVRGDVHEATAVLGRDLRKRPGREQIRLDRLRGVRLEDRNVLERSGVEHDVGPVALEDVLQPPLVANVDEKRVAGGHGRHRLEKETLVAVEQQELARRVGSHLPADLGADRPTGAGDEHGRAVQVGRDPF